MTHLSRIGWERLLKDKQFIPLFVLEGELRRELRRDEIG